MKTLLVCTMILVLFGCGVNPTKKEQLILEVPPQLMIQPEELIEL